MTTKANFSESEWQTLQWAVSDTVTYMSLADPGFFDMFKEAGAAAKFVAGSKGASGAGGGLVNELASDLSLRRDKELGGDVSRVAQQTVERVREAAGIVAAKAPEDLEAFRAFIIDLAKTTAEAAKGTDPAEAEALRNLEEALR